MSEFKLACKIGLKKYLEKLGQNRGFEEVLDAIQEGWAELQNELSQFGDDDRAQLVQHFNDLMPESTIGETLYGDLDDFKIALADLSEE